MCRCISEERQRVEGGNAGGGGRGVEREKAGGREEAERSGKRGKRMMVERVRNGV